MMKYQKNKKTASHSSLTIHPSSLPLSVREVRDRKDLDRFVKMPWPIYAEDPHWVPPMLKEVKDFLNRRKHPFYKHGDATQFIAVRGCGNRGPRPRQRRSQVQPRTRRERRLLRHVRVHRRPPDGPCPTGCGRRLAPCPRPIEHPRADRLFDQLSLRAVDRGIRHSAADHDEP